MIRRHPLTTMIRIPAALRSEALRYKDHHFKQVFLDKPVMSLAKQIPYPVERQMHNLIVLGDGHLEPHFDSIDGALETAFCFPVHYPKGTRLIQEYQAVRLRKRELYSLNHAVMHAVDTPETARTFSVFLCVDIMTPEDYAWRKKRGLLAL